MTILDFIRHNGLSLKDVSEALKIAPSSLMTQTGKKPIDYLTVNQLIMLHERFNIPYNKILGYNVFSINNIGDVEGYNKETKSIENQWIIDLINYKLEEHVRLYHKG